MGTGSALPSHLTSERRGARAGRDGDRTANKKKKKKKNEPAAPRPWSLSSSSSLSTSHSHLPIREGPRLPLPPLRSGSSSPPSSAKNLRRAPLRSDPIRLLPTPLRPSGGPGEERRGAAPRLPPYRRRRREGRRKRSRTRPLAPLSPDLSTRWTRSTGSRAWPLRSASTRRSSATAVRRPRSLPFRVPFRWVCLDGCGGF